MINTGTTIVTFQIVFVLNNAQSAIRTRRTRNSTPSSSRSTPPAIDDATKNVADASAKRPRKK